MKKYLKFVWLGAFLFALAFAANLALAQTPENIKYPVAALGNCGSQSECKTYCSDPAHADACLSFAEQNGLMSREEAALAKKVISGQLKGPGGCTSKDKCESYCNDTSHIEECVSFAKANNLMPPEELAQAEKVAAAVQRGIKPPNCRGKKECDAYCSQPANMKECMNFALQAGLMNGEEKSNAEKMLKALEAGVNPPNCKGKEECDKYCSDPAHQDECTKFAIAAGFISQEDLQKMKEGEKQFKQGLENASGKLKDCLVSAFGGDLNNVTPSRENGEKMKQCFERFSPMQGPQEGPGQGPGFFQNGPENGQPGQFGPQQGSENRRGQMMQPGPNSIPQGPENGQSPIPFNSRQMQGFREGERMRPPEGEKDNMPFLPFGAENRQREQQMPFPSEGQQRQMMPQSPNWQNRQMMQSPNGQMPFPNSDFRRGEFPQGSPMPQERFAPAGQPPPGSSAQPVQPSPSPSGSPTSMLLNQLRLAASAILGI